MAMVLVLGRLRAIKQAFLAALGKLHPLAGLVFTTPEEEAAGNAMHTVFHKVWAVLVEVETVETTPLMDSPARQTPVVVAVVQVEITQALGLAATAAQA